MTGKLLAKRLNPVIRRRSILVLLIVLLGALAGCKGRGRGTESDDSFSRAQARADTAILELASTFGAIADWDTDLPEVWETIFTIDLQQVFIDHGQPIVFRAELTDVKRVEGQFVAVFEPTWTSLVSPIVYFRLTVPAEQVQTLMEAPRTHFLDELAVVAIITDVNRPTFSVAGYGQDDVESVYLETETADAFIAEGILVAFRSLDSE
jgi:hypothetical protein